jgi:hypothetical protein
VEGVPYREAAAVAIIADSAPSLLHFSVAIRTRSPESPPGLTGVENKHLAWGPGFVFGRLVGVLTLYKLLTGRCVLDTSS